MSTAMSTEEQKALVLRGMEEIWNKGDLSGLDQFFTRDVVLHFPTFPEPIRGYEEFGKLHAMVRTAFPDLHIATDDIFAEGDRVAARRTMRATHTGEFLGFPPTGKRMAVEEFAIYRFADGKAQEIWLMPDLMRQMQQLGMLPEGPPPRAMIVVMGLVQRLGAILPKRRARR